MKRNIVLLLGAVLFGIVVSEIVLRLVGVEKPKPPDAPKTAWVRVPERVWTEHHPSLGWYHQRNKHAVLAVDEKTLDIHTNSNGFRGSREYSKDKPPESQRVMILGDSFVFGFGVEDDETFCARLKARFPQLEVLNLGVPGYGIDQILMSYRLIGRHFETDYVLIGAFPEQFWRATRSFADSGHAKPYFTLSGNGELVLHNVPVPQPFELKTNQFPDLIERGPIESALMHSVLYRLTRKASLKLGKNLRIVDPELTDEWRLGKNILKELVREVRQAGATPVLLVIPPDRWVKGERMTSLRKSFIRFAKRERVELLDLTPEFYRKVKEDGLTKYYLEGDWHWTAKGHRLAANVIARYFEDRGLVERA